MTHARVFKRTDETLSVRTSVVG